MALAGRIKAQARALGFTGVGIVPAGPSRTLPFYTRWLAKGYAGAMGYLHRHEALKANPASLSEGARSVIAVTCNYNTPTPAHPADDAPRGRVSRYAWARDYHGVLKARLHELAAFIEGELGRPLAYRAFVDSGPVMEREFAARAGLGWVGRNAMLIDWRAGSWLFLAELLVDVALPPDDPPRRRPGQPSHPLPLDADDGATDLGLLESCGSCTACIQACPTDAIVADKTVDARRCISYLTIELQGPIPEPLRAPMGEWVFGCDICQDVCPWNRHAPQVEEPAFQAEPDQAWPSLPALLALSPGDFKRRTKDSPIARPRRRGLLRNAAIVLGNRLADPATPAGEWTPGVTALQQALADAEPLVRGAAAWALARAGAAEALPALQARLAEETDEHVRAELQQAIARLAGGAADTP